MPDRLEKQLLEQRNLPITALGIVKMRPDLTTNDDTAKKMLKRSSVTDIRTLAAVLPDLATATIFVARFKAGGRRKKWHAHIFIPEASSVERVSFDGSPVLYLDGSAPPYEETKAFLESGWGEVEGLTISFWGGASGVH
jgi:hypothetical protein